MPIRRAYLPAAGWHWALPIYDPYLKLLGWDAVRSTLLEQMALAPGQGEALAALERKATPPSTNMRAAFVREVVESYDPQRAASLISRFVRNHTWHCPTLVALHTLWNDPDARYSAEDLRLAQILIARQGRLGGNDAEGGSGFAGRNRPFAHRQGGHTHDELAALGMQA